MPDPVDTSKIASASRFASAREEESLFGRDEDDILIRKERETRERFREMVTVVIDGYRVTVPKAVPRTDPQGNLVREPDGGLAPRTTTIYDAASQLFNAEDGRWPEGELTRRIPVLCHQTHQNPVAVCRMCSVQISNPRKGRPERKLLPACQHPVEDGMQVTTRCGAERYNPDALAKLTDDQKLELTQFATDVRRSVGVLAELLLADHRHPPLSAVTGPDGSVRDGRYRNELEAVAAALNVTEPRPLLPRNPGGVAGRNAMHAGPRGEPTAPRDPRARKVELPVLGAQPDPEELPNQADRQAWLDWNARIDKDYPYSARTVIVDHDRCILCDRCVRACSEDKPFKVIGHTGKGYDTRISFDLDRLMSESSCVQCGQCMTYCPTGALSLRRRVQPRAWGDASPRQIPQNPNTPFPAAAGAKIVGEARFLTADEMLAIELEYKDPETGDIRTFKPFVGIPYTFLKWNEGAVRERSIGAGEAETLCEAGTYGSVAFLLKDGRFQFRALEEDPPAERPGLLRRLLGGAAARPRLKAAGPGDQRSRHDLILGEMACMTADRRTGQIEAVGPAAWYEVTRNVLDMIQRTPAARRLLDQFYTPRAIWACLDRSDLFKKSLVESDRKLAKSFLEAVNRPEGWVFAKAEGGSDVRPVSQIGELWRALFREDRIGPGEPVTALGYEHRESLARLVEAAPADFGLSAGEGRDAADAIRRRQVAGFVNRLTPTAAARVLRELVGERVAGRWLPDARPDDPRPTQLLQFLLVPPQPGLPHGWPPPGLERVALELLMRLNPVELRRVDAEQAIVTQDDPANDFYMIRLGFVKAEVESAGVALPVAHRGPNDVFGVVALLDQHPDVQGLPGRLPRRGHRRVASVVALDPVEVVRIRGPIFYLLCAVVPAVERVLLDLVKSLLAPAAPSPEQAPAADRLPEFLQLGLYQGQRLLALDLLSCTRCDECTRACAQSHDGRPRLLREGLRFGDFLVATSCRSCHKPYCMDGCPVDAIHRQGTRLEVKVESHCIGCGLCEQNCPYGSIHMAPKGGPTGDRVASPPRRAVNCDLCGPLGGEPFCVSACPHDAAFRWSGKELQDEVLRRLARRS